ncbi:MAG: T9SS type A sorting domain-containing protein [Bacteroidia bacterium]
MKKTLLSLITVTTVTLAQAQIVIQNTDLIPLDSTVTIYTDSMPNTNAIVLGTAGVDKVWDFSTAQMLNSRTTQAKLPANTTYPQYSIITNYAWETIRGADTSFSYMDKTLSALVNKASVFKDPLGLTGMYFKTTNEPLLTLYNFPLTLNSMYNTNLLDSSVQVINMDINTINGAGTLAAIIDTIRIIITTKHNYVADAVGKLKTPQDTNLTVLRLKTYSQNKMHIEAKGRPGNVFWPTVFTTVPNSVLANINPNLKNDSTIKTYGYEFWTKESYLPVVNVITNTAGDTAKIVEWQKHHSSLKAIGIKVLVNNVSLKMYPNPTSGIIYMSTDAVLTTAKVTDITGREIAQLTINNNTIDTSTLTNGNYIITLFNTTHIAVANATIVVNK